jgi:hypothetical protein
VLPSHAHSAEADGRYDGLRVSPDSEPAPQADALRLKQVWRFCCKVCVRYHRAKLLKGVVSRHSRVLPAVSGTPDWSLSDGGGDVKLVLTESAKLNGLDSEDYLRRVLTCVTDHPVRQMHELLPWNMAKVRCRLDQREAA